MNLNEFAAKYPVKKFEPGINILNAGETPQSLYYLEGGFVKRHIDSFEGKELTIHIFESGSIFPINWALNKQTPNFNLSTLTKCKIRAIPKADFIEFVKNNNKELLKMLARFSLAVEGLAKRVEILSLEKATTRTASALHYLSKHFGDEIHFTHEEIGAFTGLSRERVSIEMKDLKDKGLISYKRNVITINSRSKLSSL